MHYSKSAFAVAALSIISVQAQAPGPSNTNPGCRVDAQGNVGDEYYYSSSDTDDFGIYANADPGTTCDPGSYAQIQLVTPTGAIVQCGYLPLDGSVPLLSCPNFPRGSAPAGSYSFQFLIDPGLQYQYLDFSITHSQETDTAGTPTQTVTVTPTDTATNTLTTTQTDTFTSSQVTVTSPAGSTTNTIFITPSGTKTTTTTITRTLSIVIPKFTQAQTTVTQTAPCSKPTLKQCSVATGPAGTAHNHRVRRVRGLSLVKRDTQNSGEGIAGDGPLTTTTTPAAVLAIATASDTTTTVTITTAAPTDASTTVPNPTPTTTIYTGTAVFSTTVTLPQKTKTKTQNAFTIAVTTTAKTVTWTHTVHTTPVCKPTH